MTTVYTLAAAAVLLLIGIATAVLTLRQQQAVMMAGQDIGAAAARYGEAQRMLAQRKRLHSAQRFTEGAVEGTTRTVEDIHRTIASVPFEVLDQIPATRDTAHIVREVHDLTSSSVYGSIRGINKLFGSGLRSGIGRKLDKDTPRDHE